MSKSWLKMLKYARETEAKNSAQKNKQNEFKPVETKYTFLKIVDKQYFGVTVED